MPNIELDRKNDILVVSGFPGTDRKIGRHMHDDRTGGLLEGARGLIEEVAEERHEDPDEIIRRLLAGQTIEF